MSIIFSTYSIANCFLHCATILFFKLNEASNSIDYFRGVSIVIDSHISEYYILALYGSNNRYLPKFMDVVCFL